MTLVRDKYNARSVRLRKLLNQVLRGEQVIETAHNAKLFLEAISNELDSASCLQRLMSFVDGFPSLQAALRIDYSYSFLNGPLTGLLMYLQYVCFLSCDSFSAQDHQLTKYRAPELKSICGREVLKQTVFKIVDPPYSWNALIEAVRTGHLNEDGHDGFSWLLRQRIRLCDSNTKF